MQLSGFSLPQTLTSIRQFVEHAVPVVYCDYEIGSSTAYVRLGTPQQCEALLEDLGISRRMLGWLRPHACKLDAYAEEQYWRAIEQRVVARNFSEESCLREAATQESQQRLRFGERPSLPRPGDFVHNPDGAIKGGPVKVTTLQAFQKEGAEASEVQSTRHVTSVVDTVSGNVNFKQPGFGARVRKHTLKFCRKQRKTLASKTKSQKTTCQPEPRDVEFAEEPPRKSIRTKPRPKSRPASPCYPPPSPLVNPVGVGAVQGAKPKRYAKLPPRMEPHPSGALSTASWKMPHPWIPPPSPVAIRKHVPPSPMVLPPSKNTDSRLPPPSPGPPVVAASAGGPAPERAGVDAQPAGSVAGKTVEDSEQDSAEAGRTVAKTDSMLEDMDDILGLMHG